MTNSRTRSGDLPRRLPRLVGALLLAAIATVASASLAEAQRRPRAVVLRFEGWSASQARRAAAQGLENDYELIDEDTLVSTASRIDADVSTPEGMAAVVGELHVTLVVGGFVEGRARRASTTVWVMDVRGNELSRHSAGAPTGRRGLDAIASATAQAAAEGMAVLSRASVPPIEVPDETEPEPAIVEPELPIEPEPPVDLSGRWNQPYVRALAGVRIRNRAASIAPDTAQNRFDSDFFPDIQIAIDARPFARSVGAERGLYLAASAGFSAGIGYIRRDGQERGLQVYGFEIDAGYALMFEETFELVLSAGAGLDALELNDGAVGGPAPDFPSTAYAYVRPAVQGRLRLVPDHLLVAEVGFGGRIAFDSGAIQRLGPEGTTTGGIDLYAGLAGTIDPGFSWAARFGYQNYWLSFSDLAAFESGTDESVQIWLLVGWSF